MEKINTDYKRRTWKLLAKLFKMRKNRDRSSFHMDSKESGVFVTELVFLWPLVSLEPSEMSVF